MSWTPPRLITERLILVSPENHEPRFSGDGRNAAQQGLPGLPSNWRILLKENDQPIGTVGFIDWDRRALTGEIGFVLMNVYSGQGYMTEACKAVLAFGFSGMGLAMVQAKSLPTNGASIRILEKIGMSRECRIQARLSSKGPLVDLDLFTIRNASPSPPGKGCDLPSNGENPER